MKITELNQQPVSEGLAYHVEQGLPLSENVYRPGSEEFFNLIHEARRAYSEGALELDWFDEELINTDIGTIVELASGEEVPLDLPFEELEEAKYQGKDVELNKPKRGGSKKFYVYTKNKKGNVIKVSFGDTTGLSVKANDPKRVASFVARHDCKNKNDRTKASYWSCRLPRYKSLGIKGGQWW